MFNKFIILGDGSKKTAAVILSHSNITLNEVVNVINTENNKKLNQNEDQNENKENLTNESTDLLNSNEFNVPLMVYDTVDAHCKYFLYLDRQESEINRFKSQVSKLIPKDIEYTQANFPALSSEELEKLRKYRPETLHQASLLEGMTQAGLVYLLHYLKRNYQ